MRNKEQAGVEFCLLAEVQIYLAQVRMLSFTCRPKILERQLQDEGWETGERRLEVNA